MKKNIIIWSIVLFLGILLLFREEYKPLTVNECITAINYTCGEYGLPKGCRMRGSYQF